MKSNSKIKKIVLYVLTVLLVISVTIFLYLNAKETEKTQASPSGTIEIKINKVTTVSIYAFGSGVEFISSSSNYDIYYAEYNTTVRLQAVNETRIFTTWSITETETETAYITDVDMLDDEIINIDIDANTPDLTVTVNRRDANASDYGKYMLDRFVIIDESEIIALQNILDGSTNDDDFAKFYENPEYYAGDNKNQRRLDLQKGYFLIANNITVFNDQFTGIGSQEYPFQGIMCGKNVNISKLFITITADEANKDAYYGLFKHLGNKAVIRNLIVSTSIGITSVDGNQDTTIYAGGLAAKMDRSTLVDVEVSSSIGIDSKLAKNIYAGGIAAIMTSGTGIDSISDVVYQGTESKWSITSQKQGSTVHAGLIAGMATDTYIKEVDIITTNQNVDLKNSATYNSSNVSKLYLGNVFGSYIASNNSSTIDDIMIMGNAGESLRAMTTNGDAIVGGLIGFVDVSSAGRLNFEKVYFRVLGTTSEFEASTINPTSIGNVYAGGIVGFVNGSNLYALDAFKNRLETIILEDSSTKLEANYLFMGDYRISAIQNGKSTATTNGKSISGGIIGKGFINLNGTNVLESNLALAAPNSNLVVEAIQSKHTSTNSGLNDKEHACAALIYGSVADENVTVNNINVYSNNTTIQTIREIGSTGRGDLHTGGFISYASGESSFTNINMYLNDSNILAKSLSFESVTESEHTNNAYCGGFAGELINRSSLNGFEFAGFDQSLYSAIGTTSHIESIQNSNPNTVINQYQNYRGENYIGGVVGLIQRATLNNCRFIGSNTSKDYIRMSGHESPDSAFCGGIVGLIKTSQNGYVSSVSNCEVLDTDVIGNATCIIEYNDPDIYIGGIIGAAYIHNTDVLIEVTNCRVTRSSVYGLGNELISSFVGGIIGGSTWESSIHVKDCYVTDCFVTANVATNVQTQKELESTAGGIMGGMKGSPQDDNVTISNCVVIDTNVNAKVSSQRTSIRAYSAGILGFFQNSNNSNNIRNIEIANCYSNALVTATHQNESGQSYIYGIAFNGTITAPTKDIETTAIITEYLTFTYNDYTFRVSSAEAGRYIILNNQNRYARINGNNITFERQQNRATTFNYDVNTGLLEYNSKFIGFNGTTLIYGNDVNTNFVLEGNVNYKSVTETEGIHSIAANNSYYLNKNVKNPANTLGTALGTGPFNVPSRTTVSPYSAYSYLYGFDGTGGKLYIELIDGIDNFNALNQIGKVHKVESISDDPCVSLAHVWINAKEDGGEIIIDDKGDDDPLNDEVVVPSHENKELAAQNGWFILDYVLLYTGSLVQISSDISNLETSYTDGVKVYKHYADGDIHYIQNKNDSSDKIYNNYAESSSIEEINGKEFKIYGFTFKVYDEMLTFNADFEITHFGANYQLCLMDEEGNIIDDSVFDANYGSINLKLVQKHSTTIGEYKDKYHLELDLNEDLEDDFTFYIRFIGGNNAIGSQTLFKVNLEANELVLVGATYADYTPPLNYYDTSGTIGDKENPFELNVNSTTKFIPTFIKSNDIVPGTKYSLEEYIEKCSFSINAASDAYFDIHSNGVLTAGNDSYENGILTITHKKTNKTYEVYFSSAKDISVSYSSVGADISGLTHASDSTDFYFEQQIRSNYSGKPDVFTITIGSTVYDLRNDPKAYNEINIYVKDSNGAIINEPIEEYNVDAKEYVVLVDKSILTGNTISVNVEYSTVCTIKFKLQCEKFNNIGEELATRTYKITSGTKFNEFFVDDVLNDLNEWVESAEKFGFVFTGFYLVNDANSTHSYGVSFDDLIKSNYRINSSNTLYGRWSYLMELIEAPGTYIKTGFNNEFMQDYMEDDFQRKIQIPINCNQGYVFRIDKDEHYVGEVGIEAYIVNVVNGEKVMTPVPIENYQDNKNLYYIRPEDITGYLVIMTTASNSEVIVGEHTSAVTENILPEDGVITYKYVINHYYSKAGAKSYIFDLNNGLNKETLNKEFVLDFYKQSTHEDLKLPDFTEIRVYYNCYVNGSLTPVNTLIGTYLTHNDDRVYLTEFVKLDLETPVFGNNITFESFFQDKFGADYQDDANKSKIYTATEVYYFSIIPPNGYSDKVQNEIANYVIECGYVEGKVATGENVNYLEGNRTKLNLANPNDLSDIITNDVALENSKQEKIYQVIPSRNTEIIEETDGTYTFIDNNTYTVYDIILTDTQKLPDFNYISLYDHDKQSILESSRMSFNIQELRLRLGYRLGNLKVYGLWYNEDSLEDDKWEWKEVGIINVTSAVYEDYIIDFKGDIDGNPYPFYAFKIDNISSNEIRVAKINVVSKTNGVVYDGPITNFVEKSVSGNTSTYTLTNTIIGDSRHDGKVFMLAIQLSDKNTENIIDNIQGNVYININDIGLNINHYVNLNELQGKNVGYINLTQIIQTLNVKTINFNIVIPENYNIYAIQLLEVVNEYKPSQGEVRDKLINSNIIG